MDATTALFEDVRGGKFSATDLLPQMYLIFGILGLFGNGLVLFVFFRVRSLRTITNLFIGNQSLIDLVTSVFLLATKYHDTNTDIRATGFRTGEFICRFWTSDYIFWALLLASTANLVLLTLERYVALIYPLTYRNRVNWYSASVAAILPWIFGFVFQSYWPAVHRVNGHACYPDWRSPVVQAVTGVAIFLMKHLTPISVMVVVYVSIVQKLKHSRVGVSTASEVPKQNNGSQVDVPQHLRNPTTQQNTSGQQQQQRKEQSSNSSQKSKQQQLHKVKSQHLEVVSQRQEGEQQTEQSPRSAPTSYMGQKVRRNVIKTLVLVAVVFMICWTPNQVMFLFYNLGFYDLDFNSFEYVLGVLFAFCNIWINPFIYTFKYRKFQHGLRKVFGINPRTILFELHT